MSATSRPTAVPPRRRLVRRAWWSLLLFPVSFAAAMVVGEGITSLLGYPEPSLASTPGWVITAAAGAALVVFVAPLAVTARLSIAAVAAGEPDGRTPLIVAGAVIGCFVVVNLASALLQVLVG